MRLGQTTLMLLLAFTLTLQVNAQTKRNKKVATGPEPFTTIPQIKEDAYEGKGWLVRLEPALFYRTAGVQLEKMVTENLSLGVNLLFKVGTNTDRVINGVAYQENYRKSGYLGELAVKYYFSPETPAGFFLQGHLGLGNIVYEDGTFRPVGINTSFVQYKSGGRTVIPDPGLVRYGIAGGYQMLVVSRRLALNLTGGLQFQNDTEGFKSNLYLSPSVGIYF